MSDELGGSRVWASSLVPSAVTLQCRQSWRGLILLVKVTNVILIRQILDRTLRCFVSIKLLDLGADLNMYVYFNWELCNLLMCLFHLPDAKFFSVSKELPEMGACW